MHEWIQAGTVDEIRQAGSKVVKGIAIFADKDQIHAVENRCPHMGFPLHRGSLCDGILTCHWHHARFDVCSGGTLDPWADDVPSHEVRVAQGLVWVNPQPRNPRNIDGHMQRLREGLEQNISLMIAKSVIALMEAGVPEHQIAQAGIEFGTAQRAAGWRSGLTILTAMVNVLPKLDHYGRILALFQGLVHVARDCAGAAPRYMLQPLPESEVGLNRLASWYRQSVEVRDTDGAERILQTVIQQGTEESALSEMMLIAATDHFYLDGGHTLDFHNKAFESLKNVPQEKHAQILTALVPLLQNPTRSEELQNWRAPVDLVSPLLEAFKKLPSLMDSLNNGADKAPVDAAIDSMDANSIDEEVFVEQILSDYPIETIHTITKAVENGVPLARLAQLTALAAAVRIQRFHVQNDFNDWIAVLHTFTHAHAVHERLRQNPSPLVFRAVYHTAMRIYLDRFLNIPSAHTPNAEKARQTGSSTKVEELLDLTNQRQRVEEAANWVANYLEQGEDIASLFNTLGHLLLREDAEFHSFQMFEATAAEFDSWSLSTRPFAKKAQETLIFALTRYLAAHAPTARELPHVARIAWRLHRGERLFEEE